MAGSGRARGYSVKHYDLLHIPEKRDPRGYILPSDQADFLTAAKLMNTLIKNGIVIHTGFYTRRQDKKALTAGVRTKTYFS